MITFENLKTKPAYDLIYEAQAVDGVIDALIQQLIVLTDKVAALENQLTVQVSNAETQ